MECEEFAHLDNASIKWKIPAKAFELHNLEGERRDVTEFNGTTNTFFYWRDPGVKNLEIEYTWKGDPYSLEATIHVLTPDVEFFDVQPGLKKKPKIGYVGKFTSYRGKPSVNPFAQLGNALDLDGSEDVKSEGILFAADVTMPDGFDASGAKVYFLGTISEYEFGQNRDGKGFGESFDHGLLIDRPTGFSEPISPNGFDQPLIFPKILKKSLSPRIGSPFTPIPAFVTREKQLQHYTTRLIFLPSIQDLIERKMATGRELDLCEPVTLHKVDWEVEICVQFDAEDNLSVFGSASTGWWHVDSDDPAWKQTKSEFDAHARINELPNEIPPCT